MLGKEDWKYNYNRNPRGNTVFDSVTKKINDVQKNFILCTEKKLINKIQSNIKKLWSYDGKTTLALI
jgi:hypothetical protein